LSGRAGFAATGRRVSAPALASLTVAAAMTVVVCRMLSRER
jgi:hypothetical protein